MDKNTKKIIGILNTIDDIVGYLINNGIKGNEYLLDDLKNAIEICNEFALSGFIYSTDTAFRLSDYFSDVISYLYKINNSNEELDAAYLENKIIKWSEYLIGCLYQRYIVSGFP